MEKTFGQRKRCGSGDTSGGLFQKFSAIALGHIQL
jgi:hypothetical protein